MRSGGRFSAARRSSRVCTGCLDKRQRRGRRRIRRRRGVQPGTETGLPAHPCHSIHTVTWPTSPTPRRATWTVRSSRPARDKVWRDTSAHERGRVLWKAGELIRERADAIGRTLTMEEGKTLAEAVVEVNVAADISQWYAEEGRRRLSIECLEVLQTVEGIERFDSPGLPGGGRMNCVRQDSVRLTPAHSGSLRFTPAHSPSTSCSRVATSSRASSSITSGGRSRITVGPAGSASTPRSMSASMCGRARSLSSMPIISPI